MSEEYTPTTEEVREYYVLGVPVDTWLTSRDEYGRAFDSWLAARDAEVARRAEVKALRGMADFFRAASALGTGERDLVAALACDERAASIEEAEHGE